MSLIIPFAYTFFTTTGPAETLTIAQTSRSCKQLRFSLGSPKILRLRRGVRDARAEWEYARINVKSILVVNKSHPSDSRTFVSLYRCSFDLLRVSLVVSDNFESASYSTLCEIVQSRSLNLHCRISLFHLFSFVVKTHNILCYLQ